MRLSVVIRSKDEADRLRLTLASLEGQDGLDEVVAVDDGSRDHTAEVLAEAAGRLPLSVVRHERPKGRSGASNAGARAARGEVVVFLDGDTLAGPGFVRRHRAFHAAGADRVGRGETWHLRATRFLQDPEAATPQPEHAERLARTPAAEVERMRVTRAQVRGDFAAVAARAEAGIYPGAGPRLLQEIELAALRAAPDCEVLWAAACGSNLSVRREAFLAAGGFDEAIDINEHRELALKLCAAGRGMGLVEGADSYHLTHRSGWRDPLKDLGWEEAFFRAHPIPAVGLLAVFWASLSPTSPVPEAARIRSLPDLAAAARGERGVDYDAVRAGLGLPALGLMRAVA
ncbi:MAG: glycosyltransferase [Proteobacteria bacterium]|nr:glycosyltransferase [Pseudomonadota bacterium]